MQLPSRSHSEYGVRSAGALDCLGAIPKRALASRGTTEQRTIIPVTPEAVAASIVRQTAAELFRSEHL